MGTSQIIYKKRGGAPIGIDDMFGLLKAFTEATSDYYAPEKDTVHTAGTILRARWAIEITGQGQHKPFRATMAFNDAAPDRVVFEWETPQDNMFRTVPEALLRYTHKQRAGGSVHIGTVLPGNGRGV